MLHNCFVKRLGAPTEKVSREKLGECAGVSECAMELGTEPLSGNKTKMLRAVKPLLRYGDFSIKNGGCVPSWI